MLSSFSLAFWYTLLANMSFTVNSCSPQKLRGQFPSQQNLLLQTPHHLPGALCEQPLPTPEQPFKLLPFPQSYCLFSGPGQGFVPQEFIHCKSISWWWWSLYPQTLSPALSQQLELQKPHHANPNSGSPLLTPSSYKLSQQIQLAAFKLLMILCTRKWDVYLTQSGLFNSKWEIMSTISHKLHLLYMLDTLHMYSDTVYEQDKIFCWNSFC